MIMIAATSCDNIICRSSFVIKIDGSVSESSLGSPDQLESSMMEDPMGSTWFCLVIPET